MKLEIRLHSPIRFCEPSLLVLLEFLGSQSCLGVTLAFNLSPPGKAEPAGAEAGGGGWPAPEEGLKRGAADEGPEPEGALACSDVQVALQRLSENHWLKMTKFTINTWVHTQLYESISKNNSPQRIQFYEHTPRNRFFVCICTSMILVGGISGSMVRESGSFGPPPQLLWILANSRMRLLCTV